ncbi:HD superfamily phosphohydrolase [Pantoea alhagi]|uniref:hypothetical protein n=1 Tax=Mixta sp. BE291 TaxID=3158787 RepID=UPI00286202E7|nr:HD superfamily phosphohydrolase [Pantoea alhagi]
MVQNISSNSNITNINTHHFDKVKKEHITALAKEIKKVTNSHKQITTSRGTTGKFEVTLHNDRSLKNVSQQLAHCVIQAENGRKKIQSEEYKTHYNENKAKLKKLEKLSLKASKLKGKIDKQLAKYYQDNREAARIWKENNDSKLLQRENAKKAQRREDARKGVFPGGMVK